MTQILQHRRLAIPVAIATTAASGIVYGRPCYLHGLTLREATGVAVADVDLNNGSDAGSAPAATITLAANESIREAYSPHGIWCPNGLFLRVNAGSVRGSVWVEDEDV